MLLGDHGNNSLPIISRAMPSIEEIYVQVLWGLLLATILILILLRCTNEVLDRRRRPHDIETGEPSNPDDEATAIAIAILMAMVTQRSPPEKKQADSTLILAAETIVIYKNNQEEAKSNCNGDICVICLGEYEDGVRCRILSNCKHMFHQSCVDSWLVEGRDCPLCRAPVLG